MLKDRLKFRNIIAFILIGIAIMGRLIPHYPNFTPVTAIALFAGTYISGKYLRFVIPIAGIYLSDLILNNFLFRQYFPGNEGIIWFSGYMIWTFVALLGVVVLGSLLKGRVKASLTLLAAVSATTLFFLISNFGVWLGSVIYPQNILGLLACYEAALPFYLNNLFSTLGFTIVFYTSMEYILNRKIALY